MGYLLKDRVTDTAIADTLVVTVSTADKHVSTVFAKLGLHPSSEHHRRVRAVLALLNP